MPRTILRGKDNRGMDREGLLAKIAKYIPAEMTALFIFGSGIIENMSLANWAYWGFFIFVLVLSPIYFFVAAGMENEKYDLPQIIISPFAVIVWVFAIGGPFTLIEGYNQGYGTLLLGCVTVLVPLVDWGITRYLSQQRPPK